MLYLIPLSLFWFCVDSKRHENWYNCEDDENSCVTMECTAEDAAIRSKIMCNKFPFSRIIHYQIVVYV